MKKIHLEHQQYRPFQLALSVYDAIRPLMTTDRRLINERLFAHVERLLEHVGCAATERKGAAQRSRLHYGRLSLTKLAITVEVAERASLISEEQADAAHQRMVRLEQELIGASVEQPSGSPDAVEPGASQRSDDSSTTDLSADASTELRQSSDSSARPGDEACRQSDVELDRGG